MHIALFNMILVKSFTGVFAKLNCSFMYSSVMGKNSL